MNSGHATKHRSSPRPTSRNKQKPQTAVHFTRPDFCSAELPLYFVHLSVESKEVARRGTGVNVDDDFEIVFDGQSDDSKLRDDNSTARFEIARSTGSNAAFMSAEQSAGNPHAHNAGLRMSLSGNANTTIENGMILDDILADDMLRNDVLEGISMAEAAFDKIGDKFANRFAEKLSSYQIEQRIAVNSTLEQALEKYLLAPYGILDLESSMIGNDDSKRRPPRGTFEPRNEELD